MKIDSYNSSLIAQSGGMQRKQQSDSKVVNKNTSDSTKDVAASTTSKSPAGDVLEVSEDVKKMTEIKSKIESGYYDSPDVLREAAEKLLKSL